MFAFQTLHIRGTHLTEQLLESLAVLAVLLPVSAAVPLGFGQSPGEPLHLGPQFPHIPLQLRHLALPLRLAVLELEPQLMLALLQPLDVARNTVSPCELQQHFLMYSIHVCCWNGS